MFLDLNNYNTKNIFVANDRSLSFVGSRLVHLNNGQFKDVLCVPNLSCNLLLMYQITHLGEGKSVFLTPYQVVIRDQKYPRNVLAIGSINDITRLYKFDNFGSSSLPSVFVTRSDKVSQFGHLNYHSLQNLCKEKMVIGVPMVSCKDGVCSGCVVGNNHRDIFEKWASWHASSPLQVVHSDLCGSFVVVFFLGFKYF